METIDQHRDRHEASDCPISAPRRASTSTSSSSRASRFEEMSASASASTRTTEQWVEDMANLTFTKTEKAQHHASSSAASRWRTTSSSRAALRGIGYNVQMLECPTNEALQVGKEFGNRGQCNPTYFTVGNLVKYLITLRDKHGMTAEGDRQELRLPHRRRVRPVPLRHVRHRVPQGAPRRRLRRLPRRALPADRRPQAGDRRGVAASR